MPSTILSFRGNSRRFDLIPADTEKARAKIRNYRFTKHGTSITEAYKSPSPEKIEAWSNAMRLMGELGGRGMRITGRNSYRFSCAFLANDDQGNKWLIYITPANEEAIMLQRSDER